MIERQEVAGVFKEKEEVHRGCGVVNDGVWYFRSSRTMKPALLTINQLMSIHSLDAECSGLLKRGFPTQSSWLFQ